MTKTTTIWWKAAKSVLGRAAEGLAAPTTTTKNTMMKKRRRRKNREKGVNVRSQKITGMKNVDAAQESPTLAILT